VHVIDGVVKPGHFPRTGENFERRKTAFPLETLPGEGDAKEMPTNRFHLVISAACPWAHRALLVRQLKDLKELKLCIVSPFRDDDVGWNFATEEDVEKYGKNSICPTGGVKPSQKYLYELYLQAEPKYTGNVTTPVLFDAETNKIVCNDSWDVIRFLDRAFKPGSNAVIDYSLYPEAQAQKIDELGLWVQDCLNNGVYKCGLARSQRAYEEAVKDVFDCLEELETMLAGHRFLLENDRTLTLADLQLFPTLVRFDDVYHILFKCSKRRLSSFYNLSNYLRDIFQMDSVSDTVDARQNKDHYYTTFESANPKKIIPKGSVLETFKGPHDREKFTQRADERDAVAAMQEEQGEARKEKLARGEFVRGISGFRKMITKDGAGENELPAEKGRYMLYVANNCPWCHRTMVARAILGLEDVVDVQVLFYRRDPEKGWQFLPEDDQLREVEIERRQDLLDGKISKFDSVLGVKFIPELYAMFASQERSVPLLFDSKEKQIVNNESAEILRIFALGFKDFHRSGAPDLYPEEIAPDIDALNTWIYQGINNGAYKAGFSSSQEAYETAFDKYFEAIDRLEIILQDRRFLTGEKPTEADVRLFPTIARHDPVYFNRMKLNQKMIVRDCPNLQRWLRDMFDFPGVREGTNIDHCIFGYFGRTGNNIIPVVARDSEWY